MSTFAVATAASADTYTCKPSEAYRLSDSMNKIPVEPAMGISFDTFKLTGTVGGKPRKFEFTGDKRNTGLGFQLRAGEVAVAYTDRLQTGETQYAYTATWTTPHILLITKGKCLKAG
ncbi:hypothetical protein [Phenylobacterium sp.]|uniref:hypothetical protein n=1 Tax=Phenylobacterium sp. TaxID=1871053 RepID=UPI002600A1F0|nr:hypothetical protein [Phenylobacterium sp.]